MAANATPTLFYGITPTKADDVSPKVEGLSLRWQQFGYNESEIKPMPAAAEKALDAACRDAGVELGLAGEMPRYTPYLAIVGSSVEGGPHQAKRIELPAVGPDWDDRLRRACDALGITPAGRPGWHLACRVDW
jgi:hypothetical protein